MADPLSIAAGVVGVLTAAAQASSLLVQFTQSSINAPQSARMVLVEVTDISGTLLHLQNLLLGNEFSDKSKTQLLQVDHVVTIMSGCVLTFSELERLLDGVQAEGMGILFRVHWARKEKAIGSLVQRLQNHKASLSLVLNILNGTTIMEAKNSVDHLHSMVDHFYQDMVARVEALEVLVRQRTDDGSTRFCLEGDTSSVMTLRGRANGSLQEESTLPFPSDAATPNFVRILESSWVYRRNNALDCSGRTVYSRDTCSMTWSCLSGISWAEVSNISVIGLPIMIDEVYNPFRSSQTWSNDAINPELPVTPVHALDGAATALAANELPPSVGNSIFQERISHDSDGDGEDQFACHGCGMNDLDGTAFGKHGKLWHSDCFRCSSCKNLLDSKAADNVLISDRYLLCYNCLLRDYGIRLSRCGYYVRFTGDQNTWEKDIMCERCMCPIRRAISYAWTHQGIICTGCLDQLMTGRPERQEREDDRIGSVRLATSRPRYYREERT